MNNNNLPEAKKLDFEVPIVLSSNHNRRSNDVDGLPDNVITGRLGKKANGLIKNGIQEYTYRCFEFEEENVKGKITKNIPSMLKVPSQLEKLFEVGYIENIDIAVADYMFGGIIGYDKYFRCPAIVLKDAKGIVVDIAKYRPIRDEYGKLPKYLYEKSENKPPGRGANFHFPFQVEMERIIEKEGFAFIGEGLKNAVNALIRSVPYISTESASNASSWRIADYVNGLFRRGIHIYGAMDGDSAGGKAFNELSKLLDYKITNLIDFNSNIDFTDYLKKERL